MTTPMESEPRSGSALRKIGREMLAASEGLSTYDLEKRTGLKNGTVNHALARLLKCDCKLVVRSIEEQNKRTVHRYTLTEEGRAYAHRILEREIQRG